MEEISRIKNWVAAQEKEEELPTKSKDRVLTQIAQGIRATNPLPRGMCNLCSIQSDRLVPVVMRVCKGCADKFLKHGGKIKFIKKEFTDANCDNCLGRTFTMYTINPWVCVKCSSKIGKTHKTGIKDMRKERIKINSKKPWIINRGI